MASLEFDGVSKVYDSTAWAVRDLTLSVDDGEFVVLVGPSGCGKTTALRMLAGFEQVTAGEIRIGGDPVTNVLPRDRDIAMVFQNYALYPHKNVYDNIGYGLKVRHVAKAERAVRIERVASMLGLTDVLKRKPSQLSGGQRQRVAMGRAIVRQPRVFLMDEPLSNLDARLRVRMRTEIATLQRDLGVTTVYVTHDQVEAMTMADRVAVLRGGRLQQLDSPQRVYSNPANLFVATFIGSPGMNLLQARVASEDGNLICQIADMTVRLPESVLDAHPALGRSAGRTIAVGVRPDSVIVTTTQEGLEGTVVAAEELGTDVILHVETKVDPVVHEHVTDGQSDDSLEPVGSEQGVRRSGLTTVVAQLPPDTPLRRGDHVTLQLDPTKLYFFDLDDGTTLRSAVATGAGGPSGSVEDGAAPAAAATEAS